MSIWAPALMILYDSCVYVWYRNARCGSALERRNQCRCTTTIGGRNVRRWDVDACTTMRECIEAVFGEVTTDCGSSHRSAHCRHTPQDNLHPDSPLPPNGTSSTGSAIRGCCRRSYVYLPMSCMKVSFKISEPLEVFSTTVLKI